MLDLMIIPYGDNLLVELQSAYKHTVTPDAKTIETKKNGLCIALGPDILESDKVLLNKVIYFDEFEDTTTHKMNGKKYALIQVEKIRGYEK